MTVTYGNRENGREIRVGDLASYRTVGAGVLKVKVEDVNRGYVYARVTNTNNRIYPRGFQLIQSPTFFEYRPRRGE